MLRTLALLLFVAFVATAAQAADAPGSVTRIGVPSGWMHQYEPTADVHFVNQGQTEQVMVLAGPGMDPVEGMNFLLREFGATQYAGQVERVTFEGHEGASLQIVTNVHERWLVLPIDGASVVVRAASMSSHEKVADALKQVVRGIQVAPATHPPLVCGRYESGSSYSGGYDSSAPSVYTESGVSLLEDGSVVSSSHLTLGGEGVSGLSQSGQRGRWEVRGDRLLLLYEDGSVSNLQVKAFRNGLELLDQQGNKLLWVRK